MHSAGLGLHPRRDSAAGVEAVLGCAGHRNIEILGIADEIVRLHGGAIVLEPTSSGATFLVTIPDRPARG